MKKNSKLPKRPSHEVFAVEAGGNEKSYWTKIGAAWPHEDGKGFSLRLALLPISGQAIHLRVLEAKVENN
jgi:hypothetical protein